MRFANEKEFQDFMRDKAVKEAGKKPATLPPDRPVESGKGKGRAKSKMTNTELVAGNMLRYEFAGCKVVFHGLAFFLDAGHTFTPDWTVHLPEGKILVVEVKARGKNGFRQPSYNRSVCMFDQTRLEWPMFSYRFMEKFNGEWTIKDY